MKYQWSTCAIIYKMNSTCWVVLKCYQVTATKTSRKLLLCRMDEIINSYLTIISTSRWNWLLSFTTYRRLGFRSRIGPWGGRREVSGLGVRRQIYWCLIYWSGICSALRSWLQILFKNTLIWRACSPHAFLPATTPFPPLPSPNTHGHTEELLTTDVSPIIMHNFVISVIRRQVLEQEVMYNFGNLTVDCELLEGTTMGAS